MVHKKIRLLALLVFGSGGATLVAPLPAQSQATSCERASALGFAAAFESADAVRRHLDAGVGVDCVSGTETALLTAARWNKPENVKLLLARGAAKDIENADGRIALEVAVLEGYSEITRILAEHMGVPDPLAPKRRAPATATPAPAPAPAPAPRPAPAAPATRPQRRAPAPTPRAAPAKPAAPRAQPQPAPRPAPAAPPAAAPASRWAPFATYRVGEKVQFHTAAGWRTGTVQEVGPAGDYTKKTTVMGERKYVILDDRFTGAGDYYDWGVVAGLTREPFWTGYFVGDWALGEVMAVNTSVKGSIETTQYSYHTASEALRVSADGSYEWKDISGKVTRGRWVAAADGPGIVIRAGVQGRDWTLRNETNAVEENIRAIETARLTSPSVMSIAAKRPLRTGTR